MFVAFCMFVVSVCFNFICVLPICFLWLQVQNKVYIYIHYSVYYNTAYINNIQTIDISVFFDPWYLVPEEFVKKCPETLKIMWLTLT